MSVLGSAFRATPGEPPPYPSTTLTPPLHFPFTRLTRLTHLAPQAHTCGLSPHLLQYWPCPSPPPPPSSLPTAQGTHITYANPPRPIPGVPIPLRRT
jgi:hypothetical protein